MKKAGCLSGLCVLAVQKMHSELLIGRNRIFIYYVTTLISDVNGRVNKFHANRELLFL